MSDDRLTRIEEALREGDWSVFEPAFFVSLMDAIQQRNVPELCDPVAGWTVLKAVLTCAVCNRPLPEWLRREFCILCMRGAYGKIDSWDDAFGRPATAAQAARRFRAIHTSRDVMSLVIEAKLNGTPIDNDLFDEIGQKLGLGRETTKKLYAEAGGRDALKGIVEGGPAFDRLMGLED
jgi:hypothetical protein